MEEKAPFSGKIGAETRGARRTTSGSRRGRRAACFAGCPASGDGTATKKSGVFLESRFRRGCSSTNQMQGRNETVVTASTTNAKWVQDPAGRSQGNEMDSFSPRNWNTVPLDSVLMN